MNWRHVRSGKLRDLGDLFAVAQPEPSRLGKSVNGDWTFVTKNSIDFRGPHEAPGSKGQYSDVIIHAGLICLNGPVGMDLDLQLEMFEEALNDVDRNKPR